MLARITQCVLRAGLFLCFAGAGFMAVICPDQVLAMDVAPFQKDERVVHRTPELRASPSLVTQTKPLALTYPRSPHERATTMTVPTGPAEHPKHIGAVRITPASAQWKVNGLNPKLVQLLVRAQHHFGEALHIISGCRSKEHNRRVDGAKRSQHLHCKAADFQIHGVSKHTLAAYLKSMPGRGGVGVYCRSSYVHLDVGPRREWRRGCGRRKNHEKSRAPGNYPSSNGNHGHSQK